MGRKHRDFITLEPFSREDLTEIIELGLAQKKDPGQYRYTKVLTGKIVGLFFEKPSLRTRLSFEAAVYQLGGQCLYMGPETGPLGHRETLKDFARVTARYVDLMVLRTMKHETIVEIARYSEKPVINGLSDGFHPCQALGDCVTILEKVGKLKGVKIAYIGDANNVFRSLAFAAVKLGMELTIACPDKYGIPESFQKILKAVAAENGKDAGIVKQEKDPHKAVEDVDVIYTDVWTSMGQEAEAEERRGIFLPYQVNQELIERAPKAVLMHRLPAHRGEEITDQALDGPRSVVYDQAENRMHGQRALLCKLLG